MAVTRSVKSTKKSRYALPKRQKCWCDSIIIVPIESSAGLESGGDRRSSSFRKTQGASITTPLGTAQLDEVFRKISDEPRRNTCWLTILSSALRFQNSAGSM